MKKRKICLIISHACTGVSPDFGDTAFTHSIHINETQQGIEAESNLLIG
jgi:hypothetical protein